MKTKRIIVSIISILFSMLMLSGCKKTTVNVGAPKGVETETFIKTAMQDLDPAVLKYDQIRPNKNTKTNVYEYDYWFMIQDTKGNVGDEIKTVYDIANDAFKEPEFQTQRTTMVITSHHFQNGVTNYVATFKNFDDNGVIYDHVYAVHVSGIDRMTDDFDPSFRYEVNDKAYWDSFLNADKIAYSDYVEYQSEIELNQDNIDEIKQYLMDDYGKFIQGDYLNAVTDGVWTPSIEWTIDISSEAVKSSDEYASSDELEEAIRKSINEYYSSHMDDEFLNLRITVKITADNNYSTVGSFSNYDKTSKENVGVFR